MKPKLEDVELTREQSEALIERVEHDRLTADDRQQLAKLIRVFFWLTLTLRETQISLSKLKAALFGERKRKKSKKSKKPSDDDPGGGTRAPAEPNAQQPATDDTSSGPDDDRPRRGHGRYGVDAYSGAETVRCRHETLAAGAHCPDCGRGKLYALADAVTIRIDGNAVLTALRYELERLRCSACMAVFTAALSDGAGAEKYSHRACVVLALNRYFLGVPFYRLQQLQAMLGVPVADATQWDQVERVADAAYPVFDELIRLAAQSALFYHDDTGVRVLSLIGENRSDTPPERVGMHTTAVVALNGERTIVLYFNGRAHAGENLAKVLALRSAELPPPLVMSDALAANGAGGLPEHIRCYCASHALRQFTEIDQHFPEPCQRVIDDFKAVYEHDEYSRRHRFDPQQRLAYHQAHSQPVMQALKKWLKQQADDRLVEPNSALGKAMAYLDNHWEKLTQFLRIPGAPLDSNIVERALKLMIRQRKNSLFFASTHSGYVAGLLASLIATCAEAGVNAMDYLVALMVNRSRVFADPELWLPWNYTVAAHAT